MSLAGEERKQWILDRLETEGKVTTQELVEQFGVSSESIRRYLEELEARRKLKRVYGGAVKLNPSREEPPYLNREVLFAEEKRRIGRAGVTLVEDNDVIFIDDGTTTQQVIHFLSDKRNVTVLTFAVPALHLLIDYMNKGLFTGQAYFLGGKVNAAHARVSGSIAEQAVEQFYADIAFISVDGVTPERGITGFDAERGQLARKIIEHSRQTVVLTDHSKLGEARFYKMADLEQVDTIVCDVEMPEEWESGLKELGVNWIHAV